MPATCTGIDALFGGGLGLLQRAEHDGDVGAVDVGVDEADFVAEVYARASARLTATVVLPTPPLPLATATRFFTPGMGWRSGIGWVVWRHFVVLDLVATRDTERSENLLFSDTA